MARGILDEPAPEGYGPYGIYFDVDHGANGWMVRSVDEHLMSTTAHDGTYPAQDESGELQEELHSQSAGSSAQSGSGTDLADRAGHTPPLVDGSSVSPHMPRGVGGDEHSTSLKNDHSNSAHQNFARAQTIKLMRLRPTMRLTQNDGGIFDRKILLHEDYEDRENGDEDRKRPPLFPGVEGEVGETEVLLLLRYARRTLRDGLYVYQLRLTSEKDKFSKMFSKNQSQADVHRQVRQIYIGTQPEYLELTTSSQVETTLHLASITRITSDPSVLMSTPEFRMYDPSQYPPQRQDPDVLRANVCPILNKKTCLLIEAGSDQRLCLIFHGERERRFAQFQIMVEQRVLAARYESIESKFAQLCERSKLDVKIARSVLEN